jgi:cytochrome c
MKPLMLMLAAAGLMLTWSGESQAANPVARCMMCHNLDKDGPNRVGPNLFGVYGRQVGIKEGFRYSPVLKTHAWIWDEKHLRAWVCDANKAAKAFSGDASAHVRMPSLHMCGEKADPIIAYLKTLQ